MWVVDGWVVLGESGGRDEVVDLAMLRDDLVERCGHGLGLRDVGVVCGDLRDVFCARVLSLELFDESLGLLLTLVLCGMSSDYAHHCREKSPEGCTHCSCRR